MLGDELVENLVTWVYEEGSYVPVAKIQNGERYTIISDYMGRPVEAYNSYGNVVWQADYDIYDDLRNIKGIRDFIPFHQLGQHNSGSSVKCVDTFRIALKEESKSCVKQIDSQDSLGCLFYLSSDTEHLTILTLRKFRDKTLKSHDIISNKKSKIKWKNTYKKQVCNQQKISWL